MGKGEDIVSITVQTYQDREPLQYVSGEQLRRWTSMENLIHRLLHTYHGHHGNHDAVPELLDALAGLLTPPSQCPDAEQG